MLGFETEDARRVGDYRQWRKSYSRKVGSRNEESWGLDYELWRMDVRTVDLGLVEDKIERAVREAYAKYLLIDQKARRLVLVLPPVMPHPLLATILTTLFSNFQYSSITLLSTPMLSVVAAGLRTGLVIDIGWAETVITGIFEFREVHHSRSTRAMKSTSWEFGRLLRQVMKKNGVPRNPGMDEDLDGESGNISLEQCEEIMRRMAWCRSHEQGSKDRNDKSLTTPLSALDPLISVPLSVAESEIVMQIPFSEFARPVESALLACNNTVEHFDDHELPVHLLAYQALLSLPPDVRGMCMSRIVVTGGGSHVQGLKGRIVEELTGLVQERDWDPVWGKAANIRRDRMKEAKRNRQMETTPQRMQKSTQSTDDPDTTTDPVSAALADQELDPIEDKLRRDQAKLTKPQVSGIFRGVETLGAWAGGSLLAGLKVKGIVEIEKDRFIQHGLAGAHRDADISVVPQRQSFGPGAQRGGLGDRSSWTLGAWA